MTFKLRQESLLLSSTDPAERAQDRQSFPELAATMLFHQPSDVPPSTPHTSKLLVFITAYQKERLEG